MRCTPQQAACAHLVPNLIDFQATTSFEVLQAVWMEEMWMEEMLHQKAGLNWLNISKPYQSGADTQGLNHQVVYQPDLPAMTRDPRDPGLGAFRRFTVPPFCRGRHWATLAPLATQAKRHSGDCRVSNWAPQKAKHHPKCQWLDRLDGIEKSNKNQIDTCWVPDQGSH